MRAERQARGGWERPSPQLRQGARLPAMLVLPLSLPSQGKKPNLRLLFYNNTLFSSKVSPIHVYLLKASAWIVPSPFHYEIRHYLLQIWTFYFHLQLYLLKRYFDLSFDHRFFISYMTVCCWQEGETTSQSYRYPGGRQHPGGAPRRRGTNIAEVKRYTCGPAYR